MAVTYTGLKISKQKCQKAWESFHSSHLTVSNAYAPADYADVRKIFRTFVCVCVCVCVY